MGVRTGGQRDARPPINPQILKTSAEYKRFLVLNVKVVDKGLLRLKAVVTRAVTRFVKG